MELHTLKPAENSVRLSKRLGRGQGSGKGGTATRGHKGAKSRSGYKTKIGFEGGQLPLQRRLPTYGFKNPNRVSYKPINLDTLQLLAEKHQLNVVDVEVLNQHGLLSKHSLCKILAKGALKIKLDVTAHAFSVAAVEAIEKLGGSVKTLKKHA
jgi:large subunit ribosomal protein L15